MNLPSITMNSVWTATTQADCTTKTSATRGDICIASTDSKSYILSSTSYSVQSDWQELLNPSAPVSQINGQVGNINFVGTNGVSITGTTVSLTNVGSGGLYGAATKIPVITTDAQGRVTSVTETTIPTATAGQLGLLSPSDYVRFDAKQDFIGTGTTAQYYRGDKTWATLDTSVIPENGNLYFTTNRAQSALSGTIVGINNNIATTNTNLNTTNSNLATATGNIATNTSNIATNTADIASLSGSLSTNYNTLSGSIATTNSNLATTNSNLATATGNIFSLSGNLSALSSIVANKIGLTSLSVS